MSSEGLPPIQLQPRGRDQSPSNNEEDGITLMETTPSQLQRLVDVEEAILMKNVLHTRNGKILFGLRHVKEYFGPDLNLRLIDLYKQDVVAMYLASSGFCCGVQKYMRVVTLPNNPIGYVKIARTRLKIEVSILKANKEPKFTAEIPSNAVFPETIEILNVNGSHPVAKIITVSEGKFTQIVFQYPSNMDAAMKVLILAAFLYLSFQLGQIHDVHTSDERDLAAIGAGREKDKKKKKKNSQVEDVCWDAICEACCDCGEFDVISCLTSLCC